LSFTDINNLQKTMNRIILTFLSILPLTLLAQTGGTPIYFIDSGAIVTDSQFIDQTHHSVNSLPYTLNNPKPVSVGGATYTISTGRFSGWADEPGDFDVIQISHNGQQRLLYRADDGITRIDNNKNLYASQFRQFSPNGYFIEIPINEGSKALIFLGQHYGTDLPRLIIFVLTGTDVKLVHNKRLAIGSINAAPGSFSMALESEIAEHGYGVSPTHTIFQKNGILHFNNSSQATNTQAAVKVAFDYMLNTSAGRGATNLPYYHSYRESTPYSYWFPVEQNKYILNTCLWSDLQLSQTKVNSFINDCLTRVFAPTNGNYRLGLVATGASHARKLLLVTTTPDGEIIDNIEVGYADYHAWTGSYIVIKQFGISSDSRFSPGMRVVVHQIVPVSATPILFENNTGTSFVGRRIDTTYRIKRDGTFVDILEHRYEPQTYSYEYLKSGANIYRDGNEKLKEILQILHPVWWW
jgi:hypothetical protein